MGLSRGIIQASRVPVGQEAKSRLDPASLVATT